MLGRKQQKEPNVNLRRRIANYSGAACLNPPPAHDALTARIAAAFPLTPFMYEPAGSGDQHAAMVAAVRSATSEGSTDV